MATFQDNVKIIKTAVYGKEMRPAITEALTQGWDEVKRMMSAVDSLNKRVDNLPNGGGGGGGIIDPTTPTSFFSDTPILIINGVVTSKEFAGSPNSL